MENYRFEREDGVCHIYAEGEIDLSNSQELRKMVLAALKTDQILEVDLSKVSYIDSSGIASLVEGLQFSKTRNKSFKLVNPSSHVKAILDLARLDKVFVIEET
jgi:anti-sigma B factor antagonist